MRFALERGIVGAQDQFKELNAAGNSLINANNRDFRVDGASFAQLLNDTIERTSQRADMGLGTQKTGHGNIVNTGNSLDLAIDGEGYFVLSDGLQEYYTRGGGFGVDANYNLIDPVTGWRVQRIGSEGEMAGFQKAGNSNIRIPYDAALCANATSTIKLQGNLSPDAIISKAQRQVLTSNITYTTNNGVPAEGDTSIAALDQYSSRAGGTGTITVSGYRHDGVSLQMALFENESGLESVGTGYLTSSSASGVAVKTDALSNGAGSIYSGSLEKSYADVAGDFANMIQVNGIMGTAGNEISGGSSIFAG